MEPDPSPLRLFCPACGADGDAADAVFILGAFAVVAELDLPLVATECKSCETAISSRASSSACQPDRET